jgi:hypothetical protein
LLNRLHFTTSFVGELKVQEPDPVVPFDTHWSRILHYDLFTDKPVASPPDQSDPARENPSRSVYEFSAVISREDKRETSATANCPGQVAHFHRRGSPNRVATTRLAVFVAIYTAVAGVVHFLFWPNATAGVPERFPASASVAAPSNPSPVARVLLQSEAPRVAVHPSEDMHVQIIDAD